MKKYTIYAAILIVGLFLGWMLFGGAMNNEVEHQHDTAIATNQMWSCSMHPQIMKPEAGDCPICGMDLIPAASSAVGLLADQFRLTKNAMVLANIQTSIVGESIAENTAVKLSGKIVENEESNKLQVSYFSGRIEQLNVNSVGEEVRKGQLLGTIYSPEIYAAQQEFITAASLKEAQPELYKAVRTKLKLWKFTEAQINEIETTGRVKVNFPMYANVSGTISEKLVAQGEVVKQGQPLFKIANLNTVWANFDVYEQQMNRFKKGQEISVITAAYPAKEFKSTIAFVHPVLDAATRTVKLRVVLSNKEKILKPGMFVVGKVKGIERNRTQVNIAAAAVLWTGTRSVVYLKSVDNAPVFEMREITLGNKRGATYAVLEGLKLGDEIVTNGTFTVDAAAQLQGKKSMMNRKGVKIMTGHEGHVGMDTKASKETENFSEVKERLIVSKDFQNQLKEVFNKYILLKDAFVKEASKNTITSSKELLAKLSQVDLKLLEDKDAYAQGVSFFKEIKRNTMLISKSTNIKEQRNNFKQVSAAVISAVQVFGVNEKVYVTFCPMADANKGAFWLSKEASVINPYFGNAMLTCGTIKQIID
jgi:Cu(I)/Ag(I) efflux system membrane fusion protein